MNNKQTQFLNEIIDIVTGKKERLRLLEELNETLKVLKRGGGGKMFYKNWAYLSPEEKAREIIGAEEEKELIWEDMHRCDVCGKVDESTKEYFERDEEGGIIESHKLCKNCSKSL